MYVLAWSYRFKAIPSVDNVSRQSGPRMMGSLFVNLISHLLCLLSCRLMVGREVYRPLWVGLSCSQGCSLGLCWLTWVALKASVGGLGSLLGPMLAAFGRSWGLCWRSWAALGALLGGPGPSWAEKWPGPRRGGDLASDPGRKVAGAAPHPRPGPRGPSQKFIIGCDNI